MNAVNQHKVDVSGGSSRVVGQWCCGFWIVSMSDGLGQEVKRGLK
jgi:hypothetical protein